MTHRLENTLGYNPVRLGAYSRATGAQDHVGLPDQRKFSPLMPSYRSPLADLLGLRYIASGAPIERSTRVCRPATCRLLRAPATLDLREPERAAPRPVRERGAARPISRICSGRALARFRSRSTVLLEAHHDVTPRRPGTVAISPTATPRSSSTSKARMAASSCSTTSGIPGGRPLSTAGTAPSCAPTSCSAPSRSRPAGMRCVLYSARYRAPGPS